MITKYKIFERLSHEELKDIIKNTPLPVFRATRDIHFENENWDVIIYPKGTEFYNEDPNQGVNVVIAINHLKQVKFVISSDAIEFVEYRSREKILSQREAIKHAEKYNL